MNRITSWFAAPAPLLSRFKLALVALGALSVAATSAYVTGYYIGQRDAAQAQTLVLRTDVKEARIDGDKKVAAVVVAQTKEVQSRTERVVRDLSREKALRAQIATLNDKNATLQRILNEKPDPLPDCRVALGDVRLLNKAASPSGSSSDLQGLSSPADLAAFEERSPSTLTCRALLSEEIAVRTQYAELAFRHDALVDWVQKELIDPMRSPDHPKDPS